jgi:hypothetical protein
MVSDTQLVLRKYKLWPLNQKILRSQFYELCVEGEKCAVKYLILSKYKFNDEIYTKACYKCCKHGQFKLLKYLLPFLNKKYPINKVFIKKATINGNVKIVKYLCEYYKIVNGDINNVFKFLILPAALQDHIEVVKYLMTVFEFTKEDITLTCVDDLKEFSEKQELSSVKYIIEKLNIMKEELDIWKKLWSTKEIHNEIENSYNCDDYYNSLILRGFSLVETQSKEIQYRYCYLLDTDEDYETIFNFLFQLYLDIQFKHFRDNIFIRIDPEMNLFPPIKADEK